MPSSNQKPMRVGPGSGPYAWRYEHSRADFVAAVEREQETLGQPCQERAR